MDDFQPSDGFIIRGAADGQRMASYASAAGDVNGDGIDDIIISASGWIDKTYPGCPAAYLIKDR